MAGKTDIGRQRIRNEDNFLLLEEFSLTAVADGMGGHVDGNIASKIAVDTLRDSYCSRYPEILMKYCNEKKELVKQQEKFLTEAVQEANRNIFARNKGTFSLEGMGTTLVVLLLGEGYVLTACVGDSRIYLLQNSKLMQVTQDHSLVGELVRYNIIGEEDLIFLQNKNIITRALGMSEQVLVDITCREVTTDDIFLLCSDGLTDLVRDKRIQEILIENRNDLDRAAETLVHEANKNGGQDNITVSLVKIVDT